MTKEATNAATSATTSAADQKRSSAASLEWDSPCGKLILASLGDELLMVDWVNGWHHQTIMNRFERLLPLRLEATGSPVIERAIRELEEYFAGERQDFDLPLRFVGTPFQIDVWRALQRVPYGKLVRYADIAEAIGRPKASRAVGAAVGQNPFSIIVPCHRVIGRDGTLVGYGGGYAAKRKLLSIEMGVAESDLPFDNGAEAHAPKRLTAG